MNKKKIVVIFGGMSTEHDVSRMSVVSVLKNMNNENYEIEVVGIDKSGEFLEYTGKYDDIKEENWKDYTKEIDNIYTYFKKFDVAFPVLHGLYGEDGTIQGLFELLKLPYVGCNVLSSSLAMDKVYTKIILDRAGIRQVPSVYLNIKDNEMFMMDDNFNEINGYDNILKEIESKLVYPMFIKPSNSGSSVGVNKASSREGLINGINNAKEYDKKILIEKGINCREIECAVLENGGEVKVSCLGEILPASDFYSYESKYQDKTSKLLIPANVDNKVASEIMKLAIKAFKAIDGKGLARVDFFIDKDTNEIYLNEINTMPGFTTISMYPKLWEYTGVPYSKLIDILIENAK